MRLNYRFSLFGLLCIVLLSACSTTRSVPPGQSLLKKNVVAVKSKTQITRLRQSIENRSELEESLQGYARQRPNKKTFGIFKFNLLVYNAFRNAGDKGFGHWMKENLGEPPVVFDTSLMLSSVEQMQGYLFGKGFLRNNVEATYKIRNRKATVSYTAFPGVQYIVDTLYYPPATTPMRDLINKYRGGTLVHSGDPLDLDNLDRESARLVHELSNHGYYRLDESLIKYDIDTAFGYDQTRVRMLVRDDTASVATTVFFLRNFKIYPDYNAQREAMIPLRDSIDRYYYYYEDMAIKLPVVQGAMFMKPGQPYSRKDYDYTISRLNDLGVFKFISIRFIPVGDDSLDCLVRLTPDERRILRAELEGTSVENDVGTGVKFSYSNRNWLLLANKVDYNVNVGTEVPLFQTGHPLYDGNMQLSYTFPKLFAPYPARKLSRYFNPRTRVSTGVNFQLRQGLYQLSSYNFSYGYEWKETRTKRHILNPFTFIGLASRPLSDEFIQQLVDDPQLRLSFQNQIITGANYSFIYTNPTENRSQSFSYFRAYGETSGFTLYGAQKLFRNAPPEKDSTYRVFGLPYSNYVKAEGDFRRYFVIDPDRSLAVRVFSGTGLYFWNSRYSGLPYIKQYYSGGSSGIRAWTVRTLGPGSYRIPDSLKTEFRNQTGDIKLEANLEYRFGVFSFLKSAVFLDAGNVWNLRNNPNQPGGTFRFDTFYKQLAVGGGIGARLDFSFFILRLDLAVPLRDPALSKLDDEWIVYSANAQSWKDFRKLIVYNLAIGYPF